MREKGHNIVYNIENLIDGKVYRGIHSTNNLNDGYMGSSIYLKQSIEKIILFDYSTRREASDKEAELVTEEFCKSLNTYNKQMGGSCGYIHSTESKQLMSRVMSGKNHPFYGKRHNEETIRKMSECKLGKKNQFYGRKHSEETKLKMRKAKLGKKLSEEHKLNLSKAGLGKKLSEEHKQSIRNGKKGKIYLDDGIRCFMVDEQTGKMLLEFGSLIRGTLKIQNKRTEDSSSRSLRSIEKVKLENQ